MPTLLQILENDAFSMTSMSEAVRTLPYQERRIGQMGLFEFVSLETDVVTIDQEDGILQIYETKTRGSDPQRAKKNPDRLARSFKVPHIPVEDRILAASLLGKRKTGMTELESVADKVNARFAWMRDQMENTFEIHRLNALLGVVKDADGSTLLDCFSAFDVVQQTLDFPFSTATTDVRQLMVDGKRLIEDDLGGIPFSSIRVVAGRNWFDEFVGHETVIDTYRYQQGANNRADLRKGFDYADVTTEEYRGMRNLVGDIGQVNDDEAYMFPVGVAGMFRANFAPGDFMSTINEMGEMLYALMVPDRDKEKWVDLYLESNPLFLNTRPRSVIKLTKS